MVTEVIATVAAKLFLGKAMQDAALDLGNETIKTGVERLKNLIRYKLGGKPELTMAESQNNEELLRGALVEACKDESFSQNLEELINQIQPNSVDASKTSISNSAVGAVAGNISGGQSFGSISGSGGLAAGQMGDFHLRDDR